MGLVAPFDHPQARRLVRALHDAHGSNVPPRAPDPSSRAVAPAGPAPPAEMVRLLVHVLLEDASTVRGHVAELEASLVENVMVWSPSMTTTSRAELVTTLLDSDDALGDMAVSIGHMSLSASTGYVEWRVRGAFTRAGFLGDDVLVEPSGIDVECSGVLALSFARGRVASIRCFYDGLALLDQVVPIGELDHLRT